MSADAIEANTHAIDWNAIHERLDGLRRMLDADAAPAPARVAQLLRERAEALAAQPAPETDAGQLEIIEFLLAEERYGVATALVREVCPLLELTPVPCTPGYVLGIIDVRGEFISVIDIKKFFDLAEQGLSDLNKVIVLAAGGMAFGILADTIVAVRSIARAELQAPPPTLTAVRSEYLVGVTDDHLALIDAEKLLGDRSLIVNEVVAE
jgi:purine-binding chemotaxis protein CheW